MMSTSQTEETLISAGEQLKHLREQKNLSVQDIASRLNLEVRIIEAIENNNFEILSAATYARGYLRSYAKILEADPDAIIASYNNSAPAPPEIIPEIKHPTQTSSSDKPVKAFTYLISLTLVILLVAWWQSNFIVDNMDFIAQNEAESEAEAAYGLSYPITVIEHPSSPFFHAVEATTEEDAATEQAEADNQQDAVADLDHEVQSPLLVTTENEGPDTLILRLTADSWIEIFDAMGNKVYVNIARQGQELSLKGTAPFNMLLGFAEGVSVEFNGEPFDTRPFTRGSIARFSLGE